jgi:Ser/Thr protein kinase RdoA (MazF antagonist)
MTDPLAQLAAKAFVPDDPGLRVEPHGQGLINDTYIVSAGGGRRLILQRLNPRAFPQPERVQANLRALLAHLAGRAPADGGPVLPGSPRTADGADHYTDPEGGFWRALDFIDHTRTLARLENATQARAVGFALGRFHALAHDLPPERLLVTREGFHQTPLYHERFRAAAAAFREKPDAELRFCLDFAHARGDIVDTLEAARRSGRIPVRVIHGDPKLDNLLFDEAGERVVALIDLDTAQPGLVHYDLGDCLRSACNPAGESPKDARAARFDLDWCRAILEGYLGETRGFLTAEELRLLPAAARLIPFELGLRFLTDHLNGDRYFKVAYRGHNRLRAATQFRLTESVEGHLDRIAALVGELAGT